ncbi:N-acetylmuramoyl-L-alanine amidase [Anaerostipes sp. PC18]|uniref:N-acetylmuramoyl-L-alanine amidase n=1 Tax=Anaerostipes sp. PC18 TaxID=3036926 RepID=UPI00308A6DCE|nr:N-acetylmuramoyl-L-alanine amidase [Anaerostipes sp. PC18]
MSKYNVHAGHCPQGKGASGAVGLLKESVEDRAVKNEVVSLLKKQGHTVYDCTCDTKETKGGCLDKIVSKCNQHSVKRDISIHLNSGRNDQKGDGATGGVEVYVYSSSSEAYGDAERICKEVSKALGITNRGVKVSTKLRVLRTTKSPALLVECCFVDDKDDYKHWDAKKCATAIVKGLTGTEPKAHEKRESTTKKKSLHKKTESAKTNEKSIIKDLQTACNKQGYSDQKVDGVAGKNTLAGCPTLKYGSSGEITKCMQQMLNLHGYKLNCDGKFGNETKTQVKKFQKKHELTADGIVGQKTWKKLLYI